MRGRFITVEGLDGAGKSTQLAWIRDFLEQRGVRVCLTREPGGTPLGEQLRSVLLAGVPRLHPETEALLMFASRREHIDKVIAPALARGEWVLCDRFTDASFAYQSGGSGVDWGKLETLEQWVHESLQPDLTLYFDVTPEIGRTRSMAVRTPDRFEQEQAEFHHRARAGYLRRAHAHPDRIRVIHAGASIPEIREMSEEVLLKFCGDGP